MVLDCTQGVHVCALCAVFLWCWTAHRVCTCVLQVAAKCEVTHEEQVTYVHTVTCSTSLQWSLM